MRTEHELLDAWRAGDLRAGDTLFRRHFLTVVRFFRTKVDSDHDDLIQRTFLGCLESSRRFRGDSTFRTFLLGVAYNVLQDHYRARYRSREVIALSELSLHDLSPTPSAMIARHREQQLLLEALRRVSIDHQIALELYFWEELTAAEISRVLEIPLGTAQTRLRRGREHLARIMQDLSGSITFAAAIERDAETWAKGLRELIAERTGDRA